MGKKEEVFSVIVTFVHLTDSTKKIHTNNLFLFVDSIERRIGTTDVQAIFILREFFLIPTMAGIGIFL